jgi:predicted transcriptional regulator
MGLGELERDVMDVLWDDPTRRFSVRDVSAHFPSHAYTTIMTVLSRLTAKGFLDETKQGRLNTFQAAASRETYIASLINDALAMASDRQAVLSHFAASMSAEDKSILRRLFARRSK